MILARSYDELHAEVSARVFRILNLVGSGICALCLAELWGRWHAFALIAAAWIFLSGFNAWVSISLLKRRGVVVGESVRSIGNLGAIAFMGLYADFPFALWLWIPFATLSNDLVDSRVSTAVTAATVVVVNLLGLRAGYGWIHAVAFDAFAVSGLLVGQVRLHTIRTMLLRGDEQRQRLIAEVAAREQVELELRQAQKLEAIGRLASGIAHEINTPVQFVSDSVQFVDEATRDLLALAARSRRTLQTLLDGSPVPEAIAELAQAEQDADLPYVVEQLPAAIARVLDGLGRITTIVRSMKEFAHPDVKDAVPADLNRALLATITIAAHEYKLVADVDFVPGELPAVACRPGELNQVFLNLIVNAAHAIGDVVQVTGKKGTIAIRTRTDGDHVVITIADTGGGIPDTIRGRIFEPFFTTKAVGRGTGQGLAIARNVIKQHGGTLTFESAVGRGTTFALRLPIDAVVAEAA